MNLSARLFAATSTACGLIWSVSANAQGGLVPSAENAREAIRASEEVVGADGPLGRVTGGAAHSSLQFSSEQGEEKVTAAITFQLNRIRPVEKDGQYSISSSKLTLTGETPLDGEKALSRLFNGDSLVTGSKIRVAFNHFSNSISDGFDISRQIGEEARLACVRGVTNAWKANSRDQSKIDMAVSFLQNFESQRQANPSRFVETWVRDANLTDNELRTKIMDDCINGDPRDVVREYNSSRLTRFEQGFFPPTNTLFWGFDASIGEDSYEVLDRQAFEIDSVEKTSWEVGGHIGLIGDDLKWSVRARAVYGREFKSPESGTECRTVTGASDPECLEAPDGLPEGNNTGLVSFEARRLFDLRGIGGDNRIGVAPLVSYRFEDDDLNIELPVYFSPDKDGKLTGGIKFAYSSKMDDFGVGLFVGVPFSTLFGS
ncbi:hypothetical protein ACI5KX_07230 [Erythrobacter sp. GH1-10]|uniref:hypothetical protein n=1 Tax=Erythrobacter sp. GH1-10 TaxID=3349334 RepID=UPI003877DBAF